MAHHRGPHKENRKLYWGARGKHVLREDPTFVAAYPGAPSRTWERGRVT